MGKSISLAARRPSRKTPEATARSLAEGEASLHMKIPKEIHRKLRIRVAEEGTSIRDFILTLLASKGIGSK